MFPYRSICSHMFLKIGVLTNFLTFTGKHLCWRLLLIKLPAWKLWTLLKRNSSTGPFRWLLQNFQKQLFLEHLLCLLLSIPKINPLCDATASYDILKLFGFICVLIFQRKYRIHICFLPEEGLCWLIICTFLICETWLFRSNHLKSGGL